MCHPLPEKAYVTTIIESYVSVEGFSFTADPFRVGRHDIPPAERTELFVAAGLLGIEGDDLFVVEKVARAVGVRVDADPFGREYNGNFIPGAF